MPSRNKTWELSREIMSEVLSEPMGSVTLTRESAETLCERFLIEMGTPPDIAQLVARSLVLSDLSGHASHGIIKILDYARRIERGETIPDERPVCVTGIDRGSVVLIDGRLGFGQVAVKLLVETMAGRLETEPIVAGGVVNASHTGRLGEWSELAAGRGFALLIFSASVERSTVAGFGAAKPQLGTNPMSFAVPDGVGTGLVLDMATSAIAGGRLKYLSNAGERAPADALLDRDGEPTTDPAALNEGGMLLTFGGHKGYGLSLLDSLLAGCVVGAAADDLYPHGVFAIAFKVGLFAPEEDVSRVIRAQLDRMRGTPSRPGFASVQVPGDYERANRSKGESITLAGGTWRDIVSLGVELGLTTEELRTVPLDEAGSLEGDA